MPDLLTKREICNRARITPRLFEKFRELDLIPSPKEIKRTGKRGASGLYDDRVVCAIVVIKAFHEMGLSYPQISRMHPYIKDFTPVIRKEPKKEVRPHDINTRPLQRKGVTQAFPALEPQEITISFKEREGKWLGEITKVVFPAQEGLGMGK